jgi:hypothetical protein
MNLNPKTDNEPVVGKLYRCTDPHLASFSKTEKENWKDEREYDSLFSELLSTQCVLLVKIKCGVTNWGTEIVGKYLLNSKVYDFFIPLDFDDTYQTAWDKYFELVQ